MLIARFQLEVNSPDASIIISLTDASPEHATQDSFASLLSKDIHIYTHVLMQKKTHRGKYNEHVYIHANIHVHTVKYGHTVICITHICEQGKNIYTHQFTDGGALTQKHTHTYINICRHTYE